MEVSIEPGFYVLAVSGGVDSMSLLHALQRQPGVSLLVAHFDHGIREDSAEDRQLVQSSSKILGLPFVYHEGKLGAGTGEDAARSARYEFLHKVRADSGAQAIITAHHRDDLLETAIINILRGTGRKGLSSLSSRPGMIRPLLATPKAHIQQYAKDNQIVWREDSTNADTSYLRNYVRRNILPRFKDDGRQKLHEFIQEITGLNVEIEELLGAHLKAQHTGGGLSRSWFAQLPHNVAREVMAGWLRSNGLHSFDRKLIERLVVAAKTTKAGRKINVSHGYNMYVDKRDLALVGGER